MSAPLTREERERIRRGIEATRKFPPEAVLSAWLCNAERLLDDLERCERERDEARQELIEVRALEMNHEGACIRLKQERDELRDRLARIVEMFTAKKHLYPDKETLEIIYAIAKGEQ